MIELFASDATVYVVPVHKILCIHKTYKYLTVVLVNGREIELGVEPERLDKAYAELLEKLGYADQALDDVYPLEDYAL